LALLAALPTDLPALPTVLPAPFALSPTAWRTASTRAVGPLAPLLAPDPVERGDFELVDFGFEAFFGAFRFAAFGFADLDFVAFDLLAGFERFEAEGFFVWALV
jgi:hypothetical protein